MVFSCEIKHALYMHLSEISALILEHLIIFRRCFNDIAAGRAVCGHTLEMKTLLVHHDNKDHKTNNKTNQKR